ncbi:hypothetical protein F4777DRAFT_388840 [Nemania sp. FL0916]|nr:hypothetical protein F4777DRAFT_388840 [Nemania sp. FL0916]
MTYIVTVIYPADTKFDMDYYLATHMPLVEKIWKSHGLKGWKIAHYTSPETPHSVQAWLEWESKEHSEMGMASPEVATIFEDVPKFSDKTPIILSGEMTGSNNL